ncbi:MAG: FkbM family methyltransferase [Oscillatoriales cyanobacterium RU_3_3]|nr:FkbM family methyltransferase [Oscillatoriales cyanobacterium RU_3_3]
MASLNLPVAHTHIVLFEKMLTERTPHERDFLFFKNFQQYPALFIDVGGNIGNSALSVHFVCPKWRVVSFEPNLSLEYFMKKVKTIFDEEGGEYSYFLYGLSNQKGDIKIYIPKIDHWYVIGEASCIKEHFEENIVRTRLSSYSTHGKWELVESEISIAVFDDFEQQNAIIENEPMIFIKIDVEGYERQVLEGMSGTIQKKHPIFMIENNESIASDPVEKYLISLGYQRFQYIQSDNHLIKQHTHSLNSFYIHSSHVVQPHLAKFIK